MNELTVVTGPPGAGKSTIAARLVERTPHSVLVPGDSFFGFLGDRVIPPWLPEAQAQNEIVLEVAATCAGTFCRSGYASIYDGVVGPWFIERFSGWADVERLRYVVLLPPASVCVDRIRNRPDHGFDVEAVALQLHAEFVAASAGSSNVLDTAGTEPSALVDVITDPENWDRFRWSRG